MPNVWKSSLDVDAYCITGCCTPSTKYNRFSMLANTCQIDCYLNPNVSSWLDSPNRTMTPSFGCHVLLNIKQGFRLEHYWKNHHCILYPNVLDVRIASPSLRRPPNVKSPMGMRYFVRYVAVNCDYKVRQGIILNDIPYCEGNLIYPLRRPMKLHGNQTEYYFPCSLWYYFGIA